jgi:hypothetical protein
VTIRFRAKGKFLYPLCTCSASTALGVKELPLLMRQTVLAKVMGNTKDDHNLPADLVKRLPALIADPVAVFRSSKKASAKGLVVLTEALDRDGDPVLVAVHLGIKDGGIEFNDISSAYGKRNIEKWLKSQVMERNVLYQDKKRPPLSRYLPGSNCP